MKTQCSSFHQYKFERLPLIGDGEASQAAMSLIQVVLMNYEKLNAILLILSPKPNGKLSGYVCIIYGTGG
jgi:hypothetical protein